MLQIILHTRTRTSYSIFAEKTHILQEKISYFFWHPEKTPPTK